MHDEDIVCTCMSVSVRDIKTAIEAGASSFQEVQDATEQELSAVPAMMSWKALLSNY